MRGGYSQPAFHRCAEGGDAQEMSFSKEQKLPGSRVQGALTLCRTKLTQARAKLHRCFSFLVTPVDSNFCVRPCPRPGKTGYTGMLAAPFFLASSDPEHTELKDQMRSGQQGQEAL